MMRRRPIVLLLTLPAIVVAAVLLADWWLCLPADATARYLGRPQNETSQKECGRCHQKEMELWQGSDHDRAMELATPETVLGDFDDRQFTHQGTGANAFQGVTSKMFRRGDKFFITTDGHTGAMETFPIKYTFGYRPLQQYLVDFPRGRVQCLPITWNTHRKHWYHLYPDEAVPFDDVLHWTRPLQNWNYMCAECHSTNLQKNYDLETDTYHTTWSEIDVSCETCHGPGSLHVKLADSYGVFWDRRLGYGLAQLKDEDSRVEIETCAPCHARRRVVYPGWRAGEKFLDYYVPELLDGNLYYADGQILEEDYVYGSFIQSKMYEQGVRCTDCHDPHSARVKHTPPDAPWDTMPDNRLCTDCHMGTHPAGTYDSVAHHHHPDFTQPGTMCVECHMPESTYMVADPRRDHSMRIPRPDLTVWLGIPNACNGCHHDEVKGETSEWAEEKLQQWYGKRKGPTHFAYAIDAGRKGEPEGEAALEAVTRRKDVSATVRSSALILLARYPSQTGRTAALRALKDPEALVRMAAVRSLQHLSADLLSGHLAPLLRDPIRAVRTETVRVISQAPLHRLSDADRKAFEAALEEYVTGQQSLGDQAAAHLNMGVVYANLQLHDRAERAYKTSIRLDPEFIPTRINLAMLYGLQGRPAEAEKEFREVVDLLSEQTAQRRRRSHDVADLEHTMSEVRYSLGLLLAEDEKRLEEAAGELAQAIRFSPNNARIHYNYGLALQRLKRLDEAEQSLKTACKLASGDPDHLHALTILYSQQKRWANAIMCAEELVRQHPGNPQMRAVLDYVKRQSQQGGK